MPFTPFHVGPNASISLHFRKYLDVPIFILVNVAIDIEPLLVLSRNLSYPVHGYAHTLLLGSLVGIAFSLIAYQGRSIVNKAMHFLYFPYETTYTKILISSLLGVWFHVLLDSPLYTDIQPFYPLQTNPLYNILSIETIYLLCIVSFIPALLIWKGIFVREYERRHGTYVSKRVKVVSTIAWKFLIIGVSIISILFALLYFLFGPSSSDYINNIAFDSKQWQHEELVYSDSHVRIRMIDDLLRTHRILGMTKEEVDGLLGKPKPTDYFRSYDYVYWLGPGRGRLNLDSEWLGLKFDGDDVVVDVRVLGD